MSYNPHWRQQAGLYDSQGNMISPVYPDEVPVITTYRFAEDLAFGDAPIHVVEFNTRFAPEYIPEHKQEPRLIEISSYLDDLPKVTPYRFPQILTFNPETNQFEETDLRK